MKPTPLAHNAVPVQGAPTLSVNIQRLPHGQDMPLPAAATAHSAGYDLCACVDAPVYLRPNARCAIPTGFAIALPPGFEGQVRPRSGLALKHGITVLNAPGTIDADYRGEISVILINSGETDFTIERGMRIAQLIVAPVTSLDWIECDNLDDSARGSGGFGSTGLKETVKGGKK
ncbi:MAG: dUTP diphosphatase [Rhodospirillaceae bacterium]|jgi:dUTP pyrophosphatase|nr:dUTP diphosphatase [Rhodospirillaceae bacterium]MBT5375022.1 dUTP diphosphatase [Rhodospirillaceae bacterium]MBT5751166.1 dUTP diphosphatase [Rhodospirillaceae bacterium]